jgi:arginine deiminase
MSGDEASTTTPTSLGDDHVTFLRALKRVVVRVLALQESLAGQILKDETLRRHFAAAVLRLYENEEALLVSLLHNAISQAIRLPGTQITSPTRIIMRPNFRC